MFDPRSFIGKEICGVTIVNEIGHGSIGTVFMGIQRSLKRKVAIKVLPKEKIESISSKFKIGFRDEAETVAILNHPNIVQVFDMGETDEILYQIMQFIEGEDLKNLIKRQQHHPVPSHRLLTHAQVFSIFLPVLDALSYAHQEGVIHRDIKPANILLDERSKRPYVVDFGIAQTPDTDNTPNNLIMGTPLYMAPEQIGGRWVDARSDIYAAGVLLFEMLAGNLPIMSSNVEKIIQIKLKNPEEFFVTRPLAHCQAVDLELEQIILKAIDANPENRYQSCSNFAKDISKYAAKSQADQLRT